MSKLLDATEAMNTPRGALAGHNLTAINREAVGPWAIEDHQKIDLWGVELVDITVWIGGRMVGIQLGADASITIGD